MFVFHSCGLVSWNGSQRFQILPESFFRDLFHPAVKKTFIEDFEIVQTTKTEKQTNPKCCQINKMYKCVCLTKNKSKQKKAEPS